MVFISKILWCRKIFFKRSFTDSDVVDYGHCADPAEDGMFLLRAFLDNLSVWTYNNS